MKLHGGAMVSTKLFLRFFVGIIGLVLLPDLDLTLFVQTAANQLFHGVINDREQRHTDDHAKDAPQPAEQDDGKQHPEAGQACAVAQNLRPNDVAVQLLQRQNKNHEPERLDGAFNQNQQRGRNRADDGAKEWNHIGDAHNGGNQQCIGESENRAADVAQHTPYTYARYGKASYIISLSVTLLPVTSTTK